jgi:hypothetical protein
MRIVPILIISLVLVSASFGHAEEQFNYGEKWKAASIGEKASFLEGYQFGYTIGAMNATKQFMPTTTESEKEAAYARASMIFGDRRFGRDMFAAILVVMDKLYEDPENAYIEKGLILEAAMDKIKGRDIKGDLMIHRKAVEKASEAEEGKTAGEK